MTHIPAETDFTESPTSPQTAVRGADDVFYPSATADVFRSPEVFRPNSSVIRSLVISTILLAMGFVIGAVVFSSRSLSIAEVEAIARSIVTEQLAVSGGTGGQLETAALVDDDPSLGPTDAPITIVEFSDYNCPFCTRFYQETLPLLRQEYGDLIRFVYRDLPIIGGQASIDAAIASNCAGDQGMYWQFHDMLFANQDARSRDIYVTFAVELGMDADVFTTCLGDKAKLDEVTLDYLDGQALGINGTPAFFINGRIVSGAQPFNTFALVINKELEKLGITAPQLIAPTNEP